MRNRTAPPALFFLAAIAFFAAGGIVLRTNNVLGAAFFPLGGVMMAIGATLTRRVKAPPRRA